MDGGGRDTVHQGPTWSRSTPISGALIGRDEELAAIGGALASAGQGRPTIAPLLGEPGIGKSRLATRPP